MIQPTRLQHLAGECDPACPYCAPEAEAGVPALLPVKEAVRAGVCRVCRTSVFTRTGPHTITLVLDGRAEYAHVPCLGVRRIKSSGWVRTTTNPAREEPPGYTGVRRELA